MIRRLFFSALLILAMIGFAGCNADLGAGIIKELEDNQDGIRQELSELWDAFLEEANEWSEAAAAFSITDDPDSVGSREYSFPLFAHKPHSRVVVPLIVLPAPYQR